MKEIFNNLHEATGSLDNLSNSIRGWEGSFSRIYLEILNNIIPKAYKFSGRSKRPAKDAFNAFLNYGYGILYSRVERALIIAGLDPYVRFLHTDNFNKKSLVFDFIEPYRDLVDEQVFYIFSKRQFKQEFIEEIKDGVKVSTDGKKFFISILMESFDEIIRYRNKNRKRIDTIQADAHAFANYLIGCNEAYKENSVETRINNLLKE